MPPLFVKLPSGAVINLSAVAYINVNGQIAFVGDDVYQLDTDEWSALRAWLDRAAVDLSTKDADR